MADNKRYYWLKLKSDFFNNLRMKKLRTIAGGDTYTIIYLKMQLLSLQDDGFLYYEGVEDSFEQEIALLINENVEDVKITISFLMSNDLMQETEKGKYELMETRTCIGSETDKAEFMRKLREKNNKEKLKDSNNVTNVLPDVTKCYTEKEKEKDIEIEKDKRKKERKKVSYDDVLAKSNLSDTIIQSLKDFIQMRQLIKKPMTNRALELCINDLKKLSDDDETQVKIIEQSIKRNWQGLYPLKDDEKSNGNSFLNL